MGNALHVYVQGDQWEFMYRSVIDGKESLDEHFLEIEVCTGMREADSDCTHASLNQKCQLLN